ncbi:sodium:proton antiporter [Microvirga sp. W0021]|uniref:Sodium:proton antiporter n=1 Tax=Hohaiivirga grylli TaxID=3133970 RepID=A0ABV0BEM7_9HYPH
MISQILMVMIAAIALTIFAERRQIQAPLLLAAVGIVVSFVPGLPHVEVPANVLLGFVLPPLLYSAALNFSFYSFMRRLSSITNLGVALVLVTAFAGSIAVMAIIPEMSFALALLLGAVVAPPDAVSAVAIGSQLHLPRRVMTILKGESLINDAAALTLFAAAATMVTGGGHFIENPFLYFLYSTVAGIVIGIILGHVVHFIRCRLSNPTMITTLTIILPFAAYALAEEVHASGVLSVVFAGFVCGHKAPEMSLAGRLQERDVWRVFDALLEAFVFAYIGLQFSSIIENAKNEGFNLLLLMKASAALLVTVIVVRLLWIFLSDRVARLIYKTKHEKWRRDNKLYALPEPLNWRENLVLSWSGMRGVVTLAAAAGVPVVASTGVPVTGWGAVLPIAFVVAIGTLLLQGLSLPWLISKLGVNDAKDKKYFQEQLLYAHSVANKARIQALHELQQNNKTKESADVAGRMLRRAQKETQENTELSVTMNERRRNRLSNILEIIRFVLIEQRGALLDARSADDLDDEVVRRMLDDMDLEQAFIERRAERAAKGF